MMKKVLGIALIIFLIAAIATISMALQVLKDGSITVTDLFDDNVRWQWDNDYNTLRWDWGDENVEYMKIDEQIATYPLAKGDTLDIDMDFGSIQVRQSAEMTDHVELSLSGRMPKSQNWSVESDKDGSVVYYNLDLHEMHTGKGWDDPVELLLTVTVPKDSDVDIALKTNLGTIDTEGSYKDAVLKTNLGEITATGSYGDVDIENNLGALRFSGAAENLTFQLDLGDADIELYEFDTVSGSVNLGSIDFVVDDDIEGKEYTVETGLGSVQYHGEFYDTINGESVELRTDLGDIELWRKDIHE